jgi:hypothetical protein
MTEEAAVSVTRLRLLRGRYLLNFLLVGSGVAIAFLQLFGRLSRDIRLRHIATREYPRGLVQSEYEVLL